MVENRRLPPAPRHVPTPATPTLTPKFGVQKSGRVKAKFNLSEASTSPESEAADPTRSAKTPVSRLAVAMDTAAGLGSSSPDIMEAPAPRSRGQRLETPVEPPHDLVACNLCDVSQCTCASVYAAAHGHAALASATTALFALVAHLTKAHSVYIPAAIGFLFLYTATPAVYLSRRGLDPQPAHMRNALIALYFSFALLGLGSAAMHEAVTVAVVAFSAMLAHFTMCSVVRGTEAPVGHFVSTVVFTLVCGVISGVICFASESMTALKTTVSVIVVVAGYLAGVLAVGDRAFAQTKKNLDAVIVNLSAVPFLFVALVRELMISDAGAYAGQELVDMEEE